MKKIISSITILFTCLLFSLSCDDSPQIPKRYTFKVTCMDNIVDTITFDAKGKNRFYLENGDLKRYYHPTAIYSYVKHFEVLKIDTIR